MGIGIAVGAVLVTALCFMFWMASRERHRRPAVDPRTSWLRFSHSTWYQIAAWVSLFGTAVLVTCMAVLYPPRTLGDTWAMLGCYAGFAAVSMPLLWDAVGFEMVVAPEGIDCRSPWRRRFIPWDEVAEVAFNKKVSKFTLRAADGYTFSISTFVPGLSMFLELCEQHLPPSALAGAREGYARVGRPFPDAAPAPLSPGEPTQANP